jgi:hypothetical protein
MIKYRYAQQLKPPAPLVNTTVRCIATGARIEASPALVDPAADRTVLPAHVVAALGLVEDGRLHFQGFAGEIVELPTFLAEIQVHDLPALMIRAVLGEREPFILLGRDVLNTLRITLDGPQLTLEIHTS